ncbi:MAG: hypothetical protein KC583_00005 [Myxococcales bacterium]|nr:hypothetical protein [Myxococcales bacterium]
MRAAWGLAAALCLGCDFGTDVDVLPPVIDAAAPDMEAAGPDVGADGMDDGIADAMVEPVDDMGADASDEVDAEGIADAMPEAPDAMPDAFVDDCEVSLVAARLDDGPVDPVDFGRAAAHGPSLAVDLVLTNTCARRLRFLGHPDEWLEGAAFDIERLPPILLEPGASTTLTVRFTPADAGPTAGALVLPYDRPGAPLRLDLSAAVEGPRSIVFIGDGRHVVTTADYGASVALDTFETLVAHGDELQRGICWGAGRFVAVGGNVDSRWWTSDDGVEWQAHSAPTGVMAGCAHGNGIFVAAAGAPLASPDGIEWVAGRNDGFVPQHLRAMTFGGGVFVAVGDEGRVVSTVDGTGWDTDAVLGLAGLGDVTWGGGRFVAVGAEGSVAASEDGVEWVTGIVPGAGGLGGVAYAGGQFVAGDGARVFGSVDGIDWQPINAASAVPRAGYGAMLFGNQGNTLLRSDDGGFSWSAWHVSAAGLGLGGAAVQGL